MHDLGTAAVKLAMAPHLIVLLLSFEQLLGEVLLLSGQLLLQGLCALSQLLCCLPQHLGIALNLHGVDNVLVRLLAN